MKLQRLITTVFIILSLALFWGCAVFGLGEKKAPKTGPEIMDRYVEASGGLKAYDKFTNRHLTAEMVMENMGLKLDIEVYAEKPDKFHTMAKSDQIGEIEKGTDGTIYWEKSMMQGPRILEGEELLDAKREFQFDKFAYWRDFYNEAEFVGIDTVKGKPSYKVILTPKEGKIQEVYFDQETLLMNKVKFEMQHQIGAIPLETYMMDYREVDGVLVPYTTHIMVMGQTRKLTLSQIEHNIELPKDIFAIPDDIKALQE